MMKSTGNESLLQARRRSLTIGARKEKELIEELTRPYQPFVVLKPKVPSWRPRSTSIDDSMMQKQQQTYAHEKEKGSSISSFSSSNGSSSNSLKKIHNFSPPSSPSSSSSLSTTSVTASEMESAISGRRIANTRAPSSSHSPLSSLHHLCASPHPSLEMLRICYSMSPSALRQRDSNGMLPLHVSINRDDPVISVVRELLKLYPESARIKDAHGNLPLFLACRRSQTNSSLIQLLLQFYPEAARIKIYGSLALHHAVFKGRASPETVRLLLHANPMAAATPNNFGNLPMHYLCANVKPLVATVRILMAAFPAAITTHNKAGETPIQRALAITENLDDEEALVATPTGTFVDHEDATTVGADGSKLISEQELRKERTRFLLRAAQSISSSSVSNDQLELLRQLNWEARKMAMIVAASIMTSSKIASALWEASLQEGKNLENTSEKQVQTLATVCFRRIVLCADVWRAVVAFL